MTQEIHFPHHHSGAQSQANATLTEQVAAAFGPHGLLSRMPGHFHVREGQTEMALAVARQIEQGGSLVIEAGTGVGKTYAYLIPALMSGERLLLSTATKALQDQLFDRDLPTLIDALGLPIRLALLKGRSNYLCTHRRASTWDKKCTQTEMVERTWPSLSNGRNKPRQAIWPRWAAWTTDLPSFPW